MEVADPGSELEERAEWVLSIDTMAWISSYPLPKASQQRWAQHSDSWSKDKGFLGTRSNKIGLGFNLSGQEWEKSEDQCNPWPRENQELNPINLVVKLKGWLNGVSLNRRQNYRNQNGVKSKTQSRTEENSKAMVLLAVVRLVSQFYWLRVVWHKWPGLKTNKAGTDLSPLDHREDGALVSKTSFYSQNSAEFYASTLATRA